MEPLLSMSSTLYCAEDSDDVASSEASAAWAPPSPPRFPAFSFYDDAHYPVSELLSAELEHAPRPGYFSRLRDGALDPVARLGAIEWILKVNAFYRFRPMTGFLSVNYLDRFLSSQTLPKEVGWPWQLLSVACLSVAAKMEETDAPPLLDLQVLEPRFVFDPRTVRRMELLLMATLRWRMHPVTPFDFVGHFALLLPLSSLPGEKQCARPSSRVLELILGTQRVVEFLRYRPSAIAAAAVLCDADGGGDDDLSRLYDVVSKDVVDECRRLMEEHLLGTCLSRGPGLAKNTATGSELPSRPQSPVGVLDAAAACGSCDTQVSAATPRPGVAEPPAKRRRLFTACSTEGTAGSSVGREDC